MQNRLKKTLSMLVLSIGAFSMNQSIFAAPELKLLREWRGKELPFQERSQS